MSDHDPFKSDNNPSPVSNDVAPADLLASIKNERGEPKYKSVEDAIKGLANSQAFIETLLAEKRQQEQELEQLREKAKKVENIDDVIAKLTGSKDHEQPGKETPSAGSLTEETVSELVAKKLAELEQQKSVQTNLQLVQKALSEKFGDKTKEVVAKKAAELKTTPEQIGALAQSNPDLVLALFNTASKPSVSPSTSSVNLPNNGPEPTLEKPGKSLLLGATSKDQKEYWLKVKEHVNKQYGITQ